MGHLDISEEIDENFVAEIKRNVELDALIRDRYDHVWQLLLPQMGRRRYMRLPSPLRPPGGTSRSLIVFVDAISLEWHWADPLVPSRVPRDVVGWVMIFDGCEYEEAVARLTSVLRRFQEYRRIDGLRSSVVPPPEDDLIDAELRHARQRIVAIGELLPEEIEQHIIQKSPKKDKNK